MIKTIGIQILSIKDKKGGVYKPRGQTRGVTQMATTLNNSYLVKLSTWGEGGQNYPKFCPRGLYTRPL